MNDAGSSAPSDGKTITEYELEQCQRANQTGRPPVVFVHGLWLLPNSWDRWAELFEQHGFASLTPGWPDDPETVQEAAEHPEVFAGKSIAQIADHFETIIGGLEQRLAWGWYGEVIVELLGLVFADGVGEAVSELVVGQRHRPVAVGRIAEHREGGLEG